MSEYYLPEPAKAIIRAMGDKYPELRKGTDDDRRAFTMRTAEQIRFTCGPAYGTKRADPGRPPSKDAIAFKPDSATLVSWDIINGSSRDVIVDSAAEDITGQTFMEVNPVDHLGVVVPPGTPPPAQPSGGTLADIWGFCQAAAGSMDVGHASLRSMHEKLDALAAQPKADVPPAPDAISTPDQAQLSMLAGAIVAQMDAQHQEVLAAIAAQQNGTIESIAGAVIGRFTLKKGAAK